MAEGAAIAIAVIGAGVGIYQGQKGQQAAKDADKAAQKQAELENQRAIRQSIAAGRVRQAELIASGQSATGGTDSSAIQGGLAAAQTQQASNIGFARQTLAAGSAINSSISNANRAAGNAALANSIAALPGQFGYDVKSSTQQLFDKTKAKAQ
jgi:hypothetical protein